MPDDKVLGHRPDLLRQPKLFFQIFDQLLEALSSDGVVVRLRIMRARVYLPSSNADTGFGTSRDCLCNWINEAGDRESGGFVCLSRCMTLNMCGDVERQLSRRQITLGEIKCLRLMERSPS